MLADEVDVSTVVKSDVVIRECVAPLNDVVARIVVVGVLRLYEKVTWLTALTPQYNPT